MTFADTARSQLFFVEEAQWGVTPALPLNAVRFTGESLNFSIDNTQSDEIRDDRQIADLIQTDAEPGGDVNFELSYGAFDTLLTGAFFRNWAAAISMSGTTFAAASGSPDSFTDSGNGFVAAGIQPGQWIITTGFSNQENNGYFQVLTVAAGTITVKGESALVNEAAGPSVDIDGETLRNGTTAKSFSLEGERSSSNNTTSRNTVEIRASSTKTSPLPPAPLLRGICISSVLPRQGTGRRMTANWRISIRCGALSRRTLASRSG